MKVKLDDLRAAFERSLQQVHAQRGDTIDVSDDLYWFIPRPHLYDPTAEPTELTLGSLEDDWAQVAAIARQEKEPIEYTLVWIASILRALGEHGTSSASTVSKP